LSVGWHRALPNASSQLVGGYQNEGGEAKTRDERRLLSVERMIGTLSVLALQVDMKLEEATGGGGACGTCGEVRVKYDRYSDTVWYFV
jgi:hypothetical protein